MEDVRTPVTKPGAFATNSERRTVGIASENMGHVSRMNPEVTKPVWQHVQSDKIWAREHKTAFS